MLNHAFAENNDELSSFRVSLARDDKEVREVLALRSRVEQRVSLPLGSPQGDRVSPPLGSPQGDRAAGYDLYSLHLMARDADSGRLAACLRLLLQEQAMRAGGFLAEQAFEARSLLRLRGLFVEAGGVVVDPDCSESGALGSLWETVTLDALWSGIEPFLRELGYDYLITSAAIPLSSGPGAVQALVRHLLEERGVPKSRRVEPRSPLPNMHRGSALPCEAPPRLQVLLGLGAQACGEASWNPATKSAEVLMFLEASKLTKASRNRA